MDNSSTAVGIPGIWLGLSGVFLVTDSQLAQRPLNQEALVSGECRLSSNKTHCAPMMLGCKEYRDQRLSSAVFLYVDTVLPYIHPTRHISRHRK